MSQSLFRVSPQDKKKKSADACIAEWAEGLQKASSFGKKIEQIFLYSARVSSKADDKLFLSFGEREEARQFLISTLEEWQEQAVKFSPELSPHGWCYALGAYSRLRILPTDKAITYILNGCRNSFPEMDCHQLRFSVSSLSNLAIYPGDEWIEEWRVASSPKSGGWSFDEGCDVIYKMAILDGLNRTGVPSADDRDSACYKAILPMLRYVEANANLLFDTKDPMDRKVYLSGLWFGRDFVHSYVVEPETNTSSRGEFALSDIFRRAGIEGGDDITIPGMAHKVDLSLTFNDVVIGGELDGVYHFADDFISDAAIYDGSTRLQTLLMTPQLVADDIRLLRIPDFIMKANGNPRVWKDVASRLAKEDSGAYILHDIHDIRPATHAQAWVIN